MNSSYYEMLYNGSTCGLKNQLTFHLCEAWEEKDAVISMRRDQVRKFEFWIIFPIDVIY